ncbi:MAG TPA: GIDE domain-containing protein [Kofleriaceae bacterium]|nr:GIDE domain-containing protein [Kofleriaceae bacterium]
MSFAILALAIAGFAGWAFWHFGEDQTIRRTLRNAPTKRIQDLRDDELGKVVGHARGLDEVLNAPLTGRRCVYFIATVEEHRSTGKSSYWKTIVRETRGVPFMLEDGSGRALVDATAARITLDFDGKSQSGTFDDPTEAEKAFLARHGEKGEGWVFNRSLRYREAVIEDGETIAVLGAGTREPDPDAPPTEAYRGDVPTRLRLTSSRKYPLVISDDPSATRVPR